MGVNDYRCTKYCDHFCNIAEQKDQLAKIIQSEHKRPIKDFHAYISPNSDSHKNDFIRIYNGKCAYCGVSIDIIGKGVFEIDHFRNKKRTDFATKGEAGYMNNLVLACHDCNSYKNSFLITESNEDDLNPDEKKICENFTRDSMFYIQISDAGELKADVRAFYNTLRLDSEMRRIDYLLMNMIGLQKKLKTRGIDAGELSDAIIGIQKKRNIMNV